MRIDEAFPSKYLKASDLQGRAVRVRINRVVMGDMGEGKQKPILFFDGKQKGMALNKTNANRIADRLGRDTDDWIGAEIELFEAQVDFKGETVPAIRIRFPQVSPQQRAPAPPPKAPEPAGGDFDDSDIPFAAPWQ